MFRIHESVIFINSYHNWFACYNDVEELRPASESRAHDQFAHAGASVHLTCSVTQPNLRIRWSKDGRPLPQSVTQKADGTLFIKYAQRSDSGRYICIIQDHYGRQTMNNIHLHIEGQLCCRAFE